ncbi:estradiol 17-beta-dehydrogenase 8 isoform X2 [Hylaeus anthracinus]|uniref:estradiol 17-beta-dehydrogenase 8 isoform X2 n=1 Tax=Hylaeus anthracinus TaxID=313031 RepID=UPI0023B8D883|nr:estradiol 17-beta-dehydrogenase 8 isoform X2 [Hylaeus anthracinus]
MVAGKIAFVTGAGSGIGREVCRLLAKQGSKVIAADRNLQTAQETVDTLNDSNHLALQLEVSNLSSVKEAFKSVINKYSKPPTIVVNSAAVKEMIDADVNRGSSIVNVGSIISVNGNMGQANYAASKAGVEALSKTATLEFGQFGIRVNTVLPGFIETPMTDIVPDNVKQMFIKRISLRRMGKPSEVAEVITFLASSKSSYVNGASINVTGGML